MSDRIIKKGQGWRVGWNPKATLYPGLVGGEDWAIELTSVEFHDFSRLLDELAITITVMAEELMDEERIACEAESDLLWLEVEGFPCAYSLRLILHQGRRCEGNWPAEVVKDLHQGMQTVTNF